MRVCDRHPTEKAADTMVIATEGIHADLCVKCLVMVRDFLGVTEKTAIDPEKPKRGILSRIKDSVKAE